jgi:hypothetical protein
MDFCTSSDSEFGTPFVFIYKARSSRDLSKFWMSSAVNKLSESIKYTNARPLSSVETFPTDLIGMPCDLRNIVS